MRRRINYRQPPLHEAICQFFFTHPNGDEAASPARLLAALQEDGGSWNQSQSNEQIVAIDAGGRASIQTVVFHRFTRHERDVVQLGGGVLGVHQRAPYGGWDNFLPFVSRIVALCGELAPSALLEEIAVVYNNCIEFEAPDVALQHYFQIFPALHRDFGPQFSDFFLGVHIPKGDQGEGVRVELSSDPTAPPSTTRLWLNLTHKAGAPPTPSDLQGALTLAHDRIEDTFEACLKPALRAHFGEIEPAPEAPGA